MVQLVDHKTGDQTVANSRLTATRDTVLCHCKTTYPQINTGSTQEDRISSQHFWDVKH